jgi:hypothetical protein
MFFILFLPNELKDAKRALRFNIEISSFFLCRCACFFSSKREPLDVLADAFFFSKWNALADAHNHILEQKKDLEQFLLILVISIH